MYMSMVVINDHVSSPVEREELNIRERRINMDKAVFLSMKSEMVSEPAYLSERMHDRSWPSCRFCRVHLLDREMEERVGSYREGKKNH